MSKVDDVLLGRAPDASADQTGASFVEGTITAINENGAHYKVPSWDNGKFTFGPSPYPRGGDIEIGYRCLVLMPDNDAESVAEPWIIGVWPSG